MKAALGNEIKSFAWANQLTCCMLHVSSFLRENEGKIACVCVSSLVQAPLEQRAYRAQWGQPHQGSPQTAGSLRWCIGLGILIGPNASARGLVFLYVCTHVCLCTCLSLSFCGVGYGYVCTHLHSELSVHACSCVALLYMCVYAFSGINK